MNLLRLLPFIAAVIFSASLTVGGHYLRVAAARTDLHFQAVHHDPYPYCGAHPGHLAERLLCSG